MKEFMGGGGGGANKADILFHLIKNSCIKQT